MLRLSTLHTHYWPTHLTTGSSLAAQVAANVAASNAAYGGDRPDRLSPAATRILYPNGDVDPWHGLSVLTLALTLTLP